MNDLCGFSLLVKHELLLKKYTLYLGDMVNVFVFRLLIAVYKNQAL